MDNNNRINEIKEKLKKYPKGTLTYKKINGKEQPYLQYTENGKSVSRYIKMNERDKILFEIEERKRLTDELALLEVYVENVAAILAKNPTYSGALAIGVSDFYDLMSCNSLYVDKTNFISEWWLGGKHISLITRPRRFGKTLLLSTVYYFLSNQKNMNTNYFKNLQVWNNHEMRKHKGKYPVIFISFASVKSSNINDAKLDFAYSLYVLFQEHKYLEDSDRLRESEKEEYKRYRDGLMNQDSSLISNSINVLSRFLYAHFNSKVVILMDEYDTPMIEAYIHGYWDEMVEVYRKLFNYTFKNNQYCLKALVTGITKIAKESLFSDLNNIFTYSVLSEQYSACCGFTEDEVFDIIEVKDVKESEIIRSMYDGYTFGVTKDIYNPWSILSYIETRRPEPFWVNTGGTKMLSTFIERCSNDIYSKLESLMSGNSINIKLDEAIAFQDIDNKEAMIFSLLLAAGYLKADNNSWSNGTVRCNLSIPNIEAGVAFERVVERLIGNQEPQLNEFSIALLNDNIIEMNRCINNILINVASFYDISGYKGKDLPERFYHGLILGLIIELKNLYTIKSNRESGLGRFDVVLIPKGSDHGIILEFKVIKNKTENTIKKAFDEGFEQIDDKRYSQELLESGVSDIKKYVIVFCGKEAFIKAGKIQK